MASFYGGCVGSPRRQAGWSRRDCPSPDQMVAARLPPSALVVLDFRNGVKIGHCGDVRCTTAFPPKAEVHSQSYYVAEVPERDICIAANSTTIRSPRRHGR